MKSLRRAKAILSVKLILAFLIPAVALALLIKGAASSTVAGNLGAQDGEKSLDIARYANEPVELVDLKIRNNSIKDKIKSKLNGNGNQARMDNVKFKENSDWFKDVKLRLRNISGRPVYGLAVSLIFIDQNLQMGFKVPIKESPVKDLPRHPLQPGEQIDLAVDDARAAQILSYMRQNGVDANQVSVQLSVEGVSFGDDFGWRQGVLMRRNPLDPKRWDVINKAESLPSASESSQYFEKFRRQLT